MVHRSKGLTAFLLGRVNEFCSADLLAGSCVGLPTHAGQRLLRHCLRKRYGRSRHSSGGKDAASTADREVYLTQAKRPGNGAAARIFT